MSWRSPRCNVGAGPAQTPRHPSAPGEGVWWALAFPGSMANAKGAGGGGGDCGLRTSLGPSCREHEAGWELKVGPTPSCVWSQALSSQGPEGAPHWKAGPGRSAGGGLGCSALDPPGVGKVLRPSLQLGPWAPGANTAVSRAGVAAAASAL